MRNIWIVGLLTFGLAVAAMAHGPTVPPDPWDVYHGPTIPPPPDDGIYEYE